MKAFMIFLISISLSACAGSDGAQGPPGEQGPQGEPGPAGTIQDFDTLAQQLAADPSFRAAIAQVLVEQYPEAVRGPKGEDGMSGECDCEGSAQQEKPVCMVPCNSASDCVTIDSPDRDEDNWTCTGAGKCEWSGCLSDGECQELNPDARCL